MTMVIDGVEVEVHCGAWVFCGTEFREWDDLQSHQKDRIEELSKELRVIHGQLKEAVLLSGEFERSEVA